MFAKNTACRICGSKNLKKFLSLGEQPPANRFLRATELRDPEPMYPLDVYWCSQCSLVQLTDIVDKEELYRNYIYFSSGMPKLSDHFQDYAQGVMQRFLSPRDLVVEIASNDGILLKFFKDRDFQVLGVDPAVNVVKIAEGMGVRTVNDFFSARLAESIAAECGPAKAILANNVVAHINDHHDLVRGIKTLLHPDGVFVLEAPYLLDMFLGLRYDSIYHEHLSCLAVRPLLVLFEKFGLAIIDVQLHAVQGNSLRVFVTHKGAKPVQPSVAAFAARELELGFDKFESHQKLARRIAASKGSLVDLLKQLKSAGKTIAAYGAPARGNTILNSAKIGIDILDYALEDLPSKVGLYTPGMHVPVQGRVYKDAHLPDYFLLLAWNYLVPILEKEHKYRAGGGKFIVPVGDEIKVL